MALMNTFFDSKKIRHTVFLKGNVLLANLISDTIYDSFLSCVLFYERHYYCQSKRSSLNWLSLQIITTHNSTSLLHM